MSKLEIDQVDEPGLGLQVLKILIMPSSETKFDHFDRIVPRINAHHPSDCTPCHPKDMNHFAEGRLASQIAAQKLPCLRIVVIGECKFWIQRFPHSTTKPRLWYLHEALADPKQWREVHDCLDDKDWAFLQGPPDYQYRDMEMATLPERLTICRWEGRNEMKSKDVETAEKHSGLSEMIAQLKMATLCRFTTLVFE